MNQFKLKFLYFCEVSKRLKNAILYKIGVHSPYSKLRIWSLKKLGHKVGKNVYFASDLCITQNFINCNYHLFIGNRVSIAPRVTILLISHPNFSKIRNTLNIKNNDIIIGDDVWIGAGAIIMSGITIGKCSIIGAGSICTKNVEPYTVVVGNPAKKLKNIIL